MAFFKSCDGVTRRDVLKLGILGTNGLALSTYLKLCAAGEVNSRARADAAIFIDLSGGPSHIDTFDPKPEAPAEYRGEFLPIATRVPGISICEHLPRLADVMGKFVILRGVHHTLAEHKLGSIYVNTGNPPPPTFVRPGYGAVVTRERGGPQDLPPFVSIPTSNQNPGFLGVQYAPLHTNTTPQEGRPFVVRSIGLDEGITLKEVHRRERLLRQLDRAFVELEEHSLVDGLDRLSERAASLMLSARARAAFDISQESPAFAARFGESPFGQSCLLATRLIEAGVRFVTITTGGWDTHANNFESLRDSVLPPFDEGLAALLSGLEEKGLLGSTVVLVTGEFGRTPRIVSRRAGRDHHPHCMCMLLAGGGIAGGRVLGASDAHASEPLYGGYRPDDVAASFYAALGIDPHLEYESPSGRPIKVVSDGAVIEDLFT